MAPLRVLAALSLCSTALAFAPVVRNTPARSAAVQVAPKDMEGVQAPTGFFDPLKLSELGSEATNMWFRQAEIKHGRVAMAAFVGWCVTANGIYFPGDISKGTPFSSLKGGLAAWEALSDLGKFQIIIFLGMIEIAGEMSSADKPHYMKGGKAGVVPYIWDPIGITKNWDEDRLAKGRAKEISNGRLAMIGTMSLFAAATMQGSVPFFKELI